MPLCVCGPCWEDLGDILRLQEASGPNMIGLTDDRFPHYGGVLSKGFLKDSEMLRGACLASTWLFSILECTAMLMNVCRAGRARAHSCRGTFRHSGNPRHKPSSISRSNSHRQTVTWAQLHTQWPLWIHHQPLTAQIHTEYMCLHSHSFPSTHGFMSEHSPVDLWPIQASKHTQGHTIWLMECIHKDPPMHTHICLNEGFGLGNSFSRNKNKCQKEKKNQTNKPEHGELHKQKRAWTYTHTVEAVSQSGLSSQLQLSACWVCFPWVQTSGEPHRFQAYVSMAAGQTDLCQESPSSLLTDHNKNWPFPPREARSKILPQALFSF